MLPSACQHVLFPRGGKAWGNGIKGCRLLREEELEGTELDAFNKEITMLCEPNVPLHCRNTLACLRDPSIVFRHSNSSLLVPL